MTTAMAAPAGRLEVTVCFLVVLIQPCSCLTIARFAPSDVLIRSYVGSLGFTTQTDWEYEDIETGASVRPNPLDTSLPTRTIQESGSTVRVFIGEARDGSRLLLKEYLPEGASLAETELEAYERMYTVLSTGMGASVGDGSTLPVANLLGYMDSGAAFSGDEFRREWASNLKCQPPQPGNKWLVFQFEGLQTAAMWPRAQQPADAALAGPFSELVQRVLPDTGAPARRRKRRGAYARALVRGMLEAVGVVHSTGVAHRGIGPACFCVSTLDDRRASSLRVRMDNFGLALPAPSPQATEYHADLRAVAYASLEVLLGVSESDFARLQAQSAEGSAANGEAQPLSPSVDQNGLRRLVEDVYDSDVRLVRDYFAADERWREAVELLDGVDIGGVAAAGHLAPGWQLVQDLLKAEDGKESMALSLAHSSDWLKPRP